MRSTSQTLSRVTFFIFAPLLTVASGEIREAATTESVAAKRAATASTRNKSFVSPVEGQVRIRRTKSEDIMDTSSFLVGPRGYTLIPRGSAYCSGANFKLLQEAPSSLPYMEWNLFLRSNSARIRVIPVQAKHLKANAELSFLQDQISKNIKNGITCITTLSNRPVRIAANPSQK